MVTGTLDAPVLTATEGRIGALAGHGGDWSRRVPRRPGALDLSAGAMPHAVGTSGASENSGRLRTAQGGQVLLFLLIMLLASMVLSNLVEEKGNKIIEVLAAADPDGCGVPRQAVRHAGNFGGRHRGVGHARRRRC